MPYKACILLCFSQSQHGFPDTQYDVGTKVFTWHLRSGNSPDSPTSTLLKEEVEVVGDDEDFYDAESDTPQFSFEAKVGSSDEEVSEEEDGRFRTEADVDNTFDIDFHIDGLDTEDKGEDFTFILKEDVPAYSPEKDIDETDEFTFVTKDDIPKLDLPYSSSDEEADVRRQRPLDDDDDVSLSSSEEYLSDEEVVVSSASSESETSENEERKLSMPDVVPQQKEPIKVYPTSSSSSMSDEIVEEDDDVEEETYDATVFVDEKLRPDEGLVEEPMVPVDEPYFETSYEIVSREAYMSRKLEPEDATFEATLEDKEAVEPSKPSHQETVFTLKSQDKEAPTVPRTEHEFEVRLEADEETREEAVLEMFMDRRPDDDELLEEYRISAPSDKRKKVVLEEKIPDASVESVLQEQEYVEEEGRGEFSFEAEIHEERLEDEDIAEVSYEIEISEPRESDLSYEDQPLDGVMVTDADISLPSDISLEDEDGYEEEFQGTAVTVLETVPEEESSLEESHSMDITPEVDQDVSFSFSLDEGQKEEVEETFSLSEVINGGRECWGQSLQREINCSTLGKSSLKGDHYINIYSKS